MEMTNRDLVIRALCEAEVEYLNSIPPESEIDIVPSKRFKKKMVRIIKNGKNYHLNCVNHSGRRIIVSVVAIILILAMSMSVSAIRTPVINFLKETWENFTHFFTTETINSEPIEESIENIMTFDHSPTGFVETFNTYDGLQAITVWENEKGDQITLVQNLGSVDMTLDTEGVDFTEISINNQQAFTYTNKNVTSIVWSDKKYIFTLSFPKNMNFEEMKNLIEKNLIKK